MYDGIKFFDVAKILTIGNKHQVEYVSVSCINWSVGVDEDNYLPLNSSTANIIRQKINEGKEVYIQDDWFKNGENEVMPYSVSYNDVVDITGYKRRAMSYIKRFINPMMANVNASVIYGFNVINNKFLEAGVVFSEENRSLKYIEVMEKADTAEENGEPEIAEHLMNLLERYIEYKEILDRSYFAWDISEKYCKEIEEVKIEEVFKSDDIDDSDASETLDDKIFQAKEKIDNIVRDFTTTVKTLNSLK